MPTSSLSRYVFVSVGFGSVHELQCVNVELFVWQHETKTYDILVKQLGEEDSRTRDSQNWIKTFKMRDLQVTFFFFLFLFLFFRGSVLKLILINIMDTSGMKGEGRYKRFIPRPSQNKGSQRTKQTSNTNKSNIPNAQSR